MLVALGAAGALFTAACSDDGESSSSTKSQAGSGKLGAARVKLTHVATVDDPTAFTTRRGDRALYVTEQAGRVRAVRDGRLDPQPVIDLTDQVGSGGERGLLGLAFSLDGTKLYVHYTNKDGDTRVDEYAMGATTANSGSHRELLAVDQPQPNHNGGS